MFEEIPLIYMSVRILKFWCLLYSGNWRRYLCLAPTAFLVFTQFMYIFRTSEGIEAIIRNSYMLMLWCNTITRAYTLLYNRSKYEDLIAVLKHHYNQLKLSKDSYIQGLLRQANRNGKNMARGNLFLGLVTCFGFAFYPLFTVGRVLPFGSIVPGVDEYATPFYELLYAFQMMVTPIGCCMYIPYTSLIVAFIEFGIVMCKSLQHRLRHLSLPGDTEDTIHEKIIACILYQKSINRYISTLNCLTAFIFLLEFIAFGTLLCALLFLLIIVKSTVEAAIVCAYITMIFAQILALYWFANELREQNLAIAAAAYDTPWFTFPIPMQKHILLLILRAQKPCTITVGHIYPMTLELFQALLNASYTYFTLLKRVYG